MSKSLVWLAAFALCASMFHAQEIPAERPKVMRTKEIWVGVHDLSPINLSVGYKHQVAPGLFMSYRVFDLQYSSSIQSQHFNNENTRYSISLGLGLEKRHNLSENLLSFHGPEVSAGAFNQDYIQHSDSGFWYSQKVTILNAALGYRLGMILQFRKFVFIGLHLAPTLTYMETRSNADGSQPHYDTKSRNLTLSLYNNAEFAIGYRF